MVAEKWVQKSGGAGRVTGGLGAVMGDATISSGVRAHGGVAIHIVVIVAVPSVLSVPVMVVVVVVGSP